MTTETPRKDTNDNAIESEIATNPEVDKFWIGYAEKTISNSLEMLDERAKYLITTCASLIVIHFGLLYAFELQSVSLKVTPEFFFVIATAFFAFSYFPVQRKLNVESPESIKDAHYSWQNHKLKWHRIGFLFFIAGLLAMAITTMMGDT